AAVGDTERIDGYWTSALVEPDGQAEIIEAIDYDFGISDRHGIFRDVPLLDPQAAITVDSPTAPDEFIIERAGADTRLRIGDPNRTISGRHRYRIEYPIGVGLSDGRISWDAVGDRWNVSISNIEIHLAAAQELSDLRCSKGEAGSWGGCSAEQPEPGHIVVSVDKVDSFEGVTVSAVPVLALDRRPAIPEPPSGPADDGGSGVLPPALAAAGLALLAAGAVSVAIRRAGRELVWAGGSADAAYGPQFDDTYPVRRVDHDELDSMASTEFAPPKDVSAWQGGVLFAERAQKDHQVAWLLERAIAGEVEIEGTGEDLTLRLLDVDSPEHEALKTLFGGRRTIDLGEYDKQFASGWKRLLTRLEDWHSQSSYWDPSGDRRRRRALHLGFPLLALGVLATIVFAVAANRSGPAWLIGVGLGGALAGAGWSLLLRSWELRVRTPEGSGLWILIESFRRFIHNSDAQHVDAAAKQGVLLDYTAWAVALGEVDRWSKAVEEAEVAGSTIAPQALYMTAIASNLGAATSSAATSPSSGGGGGGGFVGGGGGGGGGGSW
ncbi:MAG: DUF2207 family protein, partial [Acidimicrobiales bacterium]